MEKMLKTLCDLIKIKSVSGDEKEIRKVLDYCHKYFKGKKVFIKEFSYKGASPVLLIANKKTDYFDVMSVGHLDVVPAEDNMFTPRIEGDKLYGRGSLDMKDKAAVGFATMDYVLEKKLDIAFALLFTTDEETTSFGIKNFREKESINAKIIMDNDAGDLLTIIEKYKHSVGVKIKAKGLAGHSSRPWDNINAISKLIKVIYHLEKHFPQYSKDDKKPKSTWVDTMTVTAFNSPITSNVTPDKAEALLNFRLTDKTSLKKLEKILKDAVKKNSCEFEITMKSCGCYMNAKSKPIVAYKKLAEKIIGEKVKISHMCGATDARMFADCSIIIMHGCSGADVHGVNEYLEISSMYKLLEVQKAYLESLAA